MFQSNIIIIYLNIALVYFNWKLSDISVPTRFNFNFVNQAKPNWICWDRKSQGEKKRRNGEMMINDNGLAGF